MQCQNCGHNNQSTARFCANCGNQLSVGRAALHAGQLMSGGTYRVVRPLGKGGMGAIYLAEDLKAFKRLCVIKEMLDYFNPADPTEAQKAHQRFEDEARTLADLNHPGIPKIYTYFSEAGRNYIVMEYVEGQDLMQGLTHEDVQRNIMVPGQPYAVDKVLAWGIELCRVLEYLARRKDPRTGQPRPVVHHDIKPANVILDHNSGAPRLVDFGTAKARLLVQPGGGVGLQKSSVYGTVGYAPPEQYQAQSEARSDVFALAVTLYHLLTDDDPRPHPFDFPQWGRVPAEVGRVLAPALEQNVQQRPTAQQLRQELEKLVAPQGAAQPFTFRSQEEARTPAELVLLCDKYWDEGRGYLYSGQFEQWFKSFNRHDLTAQAEAVRQRGGDQNVGLEQFLRAMEPTLSQPRGKIDPSKIDFGLYDFSVNPPPVAKIKVSSYGRGCVHGAAKVNASWLRVSPPEFAVAPGRTTEITVQVDSEQLDWGKRYTAPVSITSNAGQPQIRCTIRTPSPLLTRPGLLKLLGFAGGIEARIWHVVLGTALWLGGWIPFLCLLFSEETFTTAASTSSLWMWTMGLTTLIGLLASLWLSLGESKREQHSDSAEGRPFHIGAVMMWNNLIAVASCDTVLRSPESLDQWYYLPIAWIVGLLAIMITASQDSYSSSRSEGCADTIFSLGAMLLALPFFLVAGIWIGIFRLIRWVMRKVIDVVRPEIK